MSTVIKIFLKNHEIDTLGMLDSLPQEPESKSRPWWLPLVVTFLFPYFDALELILSLIYTSTHSHIRLNKTLAETGQEAEAIS